MSALYFINYDDPILISVFIILILMSFIGWFLIFYKSFLFVKESIILRNISNKISTPDFSNYLKSLSNNSIIVALIRNFFNDHNKYSKQKLQKESLEKILSVKFNKLMFITKKQLSFGQILLASIASSAPFIGLFGTVWGIYGALIDISAQGNASLDIVAKPIGEALIATAIGLFAAVPAAISFNFFNKKILNLTNNIINLMEEINISLLNKK